MSRQPESGVKFRKVPGKTQVSLKFTRPKTNFKTSESTAFSNKPTASKFGLPARGRSRRRMENSQGSRIPMPVENSPDAATSPLEKKMYTEEERVLKEWDDKVHMDTALSDTLNDVADITFTGGDVTLTQSMSERTPRNNTSTSSRTDGHTAGNKNNTVGFIHIDKFLKDDNVFDTSAESLDEERRRGLYSECNSTGAKTFRISYDMQGYNQGDIKVKTVGRQLIVSAMHREKEQGRHSTTEFCRKVKLPEDVDLDKVSASMDNAGLLTLEAPVKQRLSSTTSHFSHLSSTSDSTNKQAALPVDKPVVRESAGGVQTLYLLAEVGRVFRSADVVVKVRGTNTLVVEAEREDANDVSKISARVYREYQLPAAISPSHLKAGLAPNGRLIITAAVDISHSSQLNGHILKNEL